MMHLTLKGLESPGSLEVRWGGGGDIHMETGWGGEEVWDVEQSKVDGGGDKIWTIKNKLINFKKIKEKNVLESE